jgi:hypothetical protein
MAMAFRGNDPGWYITKWLEVATGKNVTCQKARLQDRLMFGCMRCGQSLTTKTDAVKTDGTVDYSLQEFVKIHAHKGGHNDPVDLEKSEGYGKVIPLTADFKTVKIDDKPEIAAKIKANMDAFNEQMAKTLDDKVLAAKIAKLQSNKVLKQSVGRKFR